MSEKYWFLKRCDLFERLSAEDLQFVESRCRLRRFSRGSPIYLPADQADAVMLLASGRVKICSFTSDGKQSILAFIDQGEMFGELSLFGPGEREEYAEAIDTSTVMCIPADSMRDLIQRHPDVGLGITRLIGLRRKRIERRLKYLLFHSNRERLAHLLLELSEQYGESTGEGVELGIKLSHQDLANIIGSTRETVTVILGEMQSEGFLQIGRRKIILRNIQGLALSVNGKVPRLRDSRPPVSANPIGPGRHPAENIS